MLLVLQIGAAIRNGELLSSCGHLHNEYTIFEYERISRQNRRKQIDHFVDPSA